MPGSGSHFIVILFLPHIQVLYFDGARYFPEETEKIMEILEEKELRLRTPLEEVKLLQEINE